MINTIIFDGGGVLIKLGMPKPLLLKALFASVGLDCAAMERGLLAAQEFIPAWTDGAVRLNDLYCELRLREQYAAAIADATGQDARFAKLLTMTTFEAPTFSLYEDVLPVLQKLQGRYKLALLSNSVPSLRVALEGLGIGRFFDEIIISSETGFMKPDAQIFSLALQKMNADARHTLYIDDSEKYIMAARQIGLNARLLERSRQTLPEILADIVAGNQVTVN